GAVELRVAADVVVRVGMELAAVSIAPRLLRRVATLEVDGPRAPVGLLARDVAAALEEENALAGRRERREQRAAAGARADDDHVVASGHGMRAPAESVRGISGAEAVAMGAGTRNGPGPTSLAAERSGTMSSVYRQRKMHRRGLSWSSLAQYTAAAPQ